LAPVFNVALGAPLCAGSATSLATAVLPAGAYAFNQGPWQMTTFEENDLTHSAERFAIKTKEQAPWRIGGVTHGWFREACRATELSREDAAKGKVNIPVLIIQAGRDTAVSNRAQKEFCDKVNETAKGRCEGYVLPDSYHAVFIEEDTIRTPAITKILDFFAAHA
jgi:lysophospholipase